MRLAQSDHWDHLVNQDREENLVCQVYLVLMVPQETLEIRGKLVLRDIKDPLVIL